MKKFFNRLMPAFLCGLLLMFSACSDFFVDLKDNVTNIEVSYKVEHWKQTVDGKSYTLDVDESQMLRGMSLSNTNAQSKDFEGFSSKKISQAVIKRDGTTVVKVFYDRNIISYTFIANRGTYKGNRDSITISGRYGAPVIIPEYPSRSGYVFNIWDEAVPDVFGAEERTFTATWTPGTGTAYTVQHFIEKIEVVDEYEATAYAVETKHGTTETMTAAVPNDYPGFEVQGITQEIINGDGSTVVNVFYKRKTITYTFRPNGGNWNGTAADWVIRGRYETAVSKPANPTRNGYNFGNWGTVPDTFGPEDTVFTGTWFARSDTPYTVEHWKQNANDDDYTLETADTESKTGVTDALTAATAKTYSGFYVKDFVQETIKPDGSAVVKIYYDRNIITYTFKSGTDGKWSNSVTEKRTSGRYGAPVVKPDEPTANDSPTYIFQRWLYLPQTYGLKDASYTASYTYNLYETPVKLPAGTDGTAGTNWTYVYFGVYPQTIKPENVTITNNARTIGKKVCYLGSDNRFYYKCKESGYPATGTDEDDNEYRIYYHYSDGSVVKTSSEDSYRYFRIEPVKWRVLTNSYNNTGKALLFAESALEGGIPFNQSSTIYSCSDYQQTRMYMYLNSTFIEDLFTSKAQSLIESTYVNHSLETGFPKIAYDYWKNNNTREWPSCYEKIFLLSVQEVTDPDFGFSSNPYSGDISRIRKSTDYTKARYSFNSTISGKGVIWWTRSIGGYFEYYVLSIHPSGSFDRITTYCALGRPCHFAYLTIVPALCVDPSVIK